MQSVFNLHLFFLLDSKGVTHRTSVWLPERVGLGSTLVRGQTRILSLEPVSHEPSRSKRDHVRPGDTHSKSITSLLSSSAVSIDNENLKQHISFPPIRRANGVTCEPGDVYRAKKSLPRLGANLSDIKWTSWTVFCAFYNEPVPW